MDSLPSELIHFIQHFRPLFRAEVFDTFALLLTGLLIGDAKAGTVRSSVFAAADYQPQRLSDFFCRHKLSHQAFMAKLVAVALARLYPSGLPKRLFWIADSTTTDKPFANKVASIGLFHRSQHVVGRAKHLKGHCFVFAAHLYQLGTVEAKRWASLLVGALVYVKGKTIPALVGQLAQHLRLPKGVRHVWLVDRGILSRTLIRQLSAEDQFVLGRARANQVVYFAPRRQPRRGRKRLYGQKCRLDQLLRRFPGRLQTQTMKFSVRGKERHVEVHSAEIQLRGVWCGRVCAARIIIVEVPGLKLKPWYLLTTDLDLEAVEAVRAYDGRYQIEVNMDEVKELGLGHYQGRSGQGVRRWPLLLCASQMLLKLIGTDVLQVALPSLNWSWYPRENTVGQVRRRLIEHCRPRISRRKSERLTAKKFSEATEFQ
jgi:DDE family transposase